MPAQSPYSGPARGALALAASIALAACATERPAPIACDVEPYLLPLEAAPGPADDAAAGLSPYERALRDALAAPGPPALTDRPAAPPRTLALSGGGPWGAYGAGFLKGWSEAPGGFPEFRAVTGVSTGGLQATFAFLAGGDGGDSLDRLDALYRDVENPDIYAPRGQLRALFGANAFNTLDPLRRLIRREIEAQGWIEAVAEEARRQPARKLFVGVVDLDSGQLLAADLTALAAGGLSPAEKTACYTELLVASAAVPVAFDPVATASASPPRQRLLVDGGVRAAAFIEASERAQAAVAARADRDFAGETVVVMNGTLEMCTETTKGGILNIGARSVAALIKQNTVNSLANILARRGSGGQCTRYTHVAPSATLCAEDADTTSFDPDFMNRLANLGQARWEAGAPFESVGACAAGAG